MNHKISTFAFLFTRGVSLRLWLKRGMLTREVLLQRMMIDRGCVDKIYWFTYGSEDEDLYSELIKNHHFSQHVVVKGMPRFFSFPFGTFLYSLVMPFIYCKEFRECEYIRTNQMDGAWTGLVTKVFFGKLFFLRTGFTWSQLVRLGHKSSRSIKRRVKLAFILFAEKLCYRFCDVATVTSQHNLKYLQETVKIHTTNISILPNYVDTSQFKPLGGNRRTDRILFVGRINHVKNIPNLLFAANRLGLGVDFYGDGDHQVEVEEFAKKNNISNYHFHGAVSHELLVGIYNAYKYYALTSMTEGMPKTLIEAMACGCICIGTNVAGINEIIENGENGFLAADTSWGSIEDALRQAMESDSETIIANAVSYVNENFSPSMVLDREIQLIEAMKKSRKPSIP